MTYVERLLAGVALDAFTLRRALRGAETNRVNRHRASGAFIIEEWPVRGGKSLRMSDAIRKHFNP